MFTNCCHRVSCSFVIFSVFIPNDEKCKWSFWRYKYGTLLVIV
uniref:Uncharacterized protein n=1 Tax=Heterorhabditis bacteriophora TaxID=37862 RepID=A0A1I7X068_HETBA